MSRERSESGIAIAVMGPTASGKTELAEAIAERLDARLVSADAFQVYRGLDIGTNKPLRTDRYAMIDVADPSETYTVGRYVSEARPICARTTDLGTNVVIVGGTGLYVRRLLDDSSALSLPPPAGLRERLRKTLEDSGVEDLLAEAKLNREDLNAQTLMNPVHLVRAAERAIVGRAEPPVLWSARRYKVAILRPRAEIVTRIEKRLSQMLQNGWLDEVRELLSRWPRESPAFRAIGYRELIDVVESRTDLTEAVSRIAVRTRQYAKRQMTWLRAEPDVLWFPANGGVEEIAGKVLDEIDKLGGGQNGESN